MNKTKKKDPHAHTEGGRAPRAQEHRPRQPPAKEPTKDNPRTTKLRTNPTPPAKDNPQPTKGSPRGPTKPGNQPT